MWVSKKTDYALRVLFTLVDHFGGTPIPIRELARRNDVPKRFLEQIMLDLKKQGKTILFSTHRMDQVEKLCDSICLINKGNAVLQGDLKTIKAGYGKSNVQIEYEGNGDFLEKNPLVSTYNNYGNYVEVRLAPGADAQQLLHMVAEKSRVNKFELMEPSLEEIFINTVGKDNA